MDGSEASRAHNIAGAYVHWNFMVTLDLNDGELEAFELSGVVESIRPIRKWSTIDICFT